MTDSLQQLPLAVSILMFIAAAGLIGFFGIRMTALARDLARITRLGEAVMGAVFIGASTSLSGITASATAAWYGDAQLAVSNSLGGIAAQTLFLVLGDIVYRKYNLEYAAASVENMLMSAQLILLLSILLVAFLLPDFSIWGIHPASPVLLGTYLFTVKMLMDTHEKPMWLPRMSRGTVLENKTRPRRIKGETTRVVLGFVGCAAVVAFAGWLIANAGLEIVRRSDMSAGVMGGMFIAISTSLPELVVAVTAVRMGALTLAVGDIIGGNAFDTLFIAVSDVFYREGSIYQAVSQQEHLWLSCAFLMTAVLLLGLMYRQKKGFANIGLESAIILLIYVATASYMAS